MVKPRNFDDEDSPDREQAGANRSGRSEHSDREISLGAPAILGIFFALAVLCACFFGFGYTMGRKSAQIAPTDATASAVDSSIGGVAKPTAGSLANVSPVAAAQPANNNSAAPAAPTPEPAAPSPAPAKSTTSDAMIAGDKPAAAPQANSSRPPAPAISPTGTIMVQIAAVSSQDVADILLASLKKKGYSVSVRHEPQDKLLHVQIGPFATRKDAEAMCQRVMADGFNAIVK
jgi:cell division septation protein DedD